MNTDKRETKTMGSSITSVLVALSITIGIAQVADASNKKHPPVARGVKIALKMASTDKVAVNDKDDKSKDAKDSKDSKNLKSDKDSNAAKKKAEADKEKEKAAKKADEAKAKAEAKAKKDDKNDKTAKDDKGDGKGFFKGIFGKEETKEPVKASEPASVKTPASGDDAAAGAATVAPPATPAPVAVPVAKPNVQVTVDTANGAEPKFIPDAALISILKDISRSLADNEDIKNVEDPAQKMAIKLASEALSKALSHPDLITDRIIAVDDRSRVETRLVAENWDSQLIQLSPNCTASLSALWAKRANGLVNISIAGTCNCKPASTATPETKIGEWIVVLTGKSGVDKGFDIQTQSEVPFWIGKLSSFTVEATACSQEASEPGKKPQSPALVLKSVLTERSRKHLEALTAWQNAHKLAALQAEQERARTDEEAKVAADNKAKELEKQTLEAKLEIEKARLENELRARLAAEAALKAVAEQKARELAELDAKAKMDEKARAEAELKAKLEAEMKAKEAELKAKEAEMKDKEAELKAKIEAEFKAEAEKKAKAEAELKAKADAEQKAKEEAQLKAKAEEEAAKAKLATANTIPSYGDTRRSWESPAPLTAPSGTRVPSGKTRLLLPDRAVAGQYVTAAVVNEQNGGESYIELNFNGAGLTTTNDGKVHYMVPEDAPPGPTVLVAVPSQPLDAPRALEILQPLMVPSTQQVPRIDRANPLLSVGEILTIDGHSFDGVADNNRVIIDGAHDARVLAASPV